MSLNTERNNTYLAEASISPHITTTCDSLKYTIITFWRETSPNYLPSGNKGSSPNIRCFLKAHYNHKLKINTTANVLTIKDNQGSFLADVVGNEWAGILGEFSCLN